jgi:hypothetical protein
VIPSGFRALAVVSTSKKLKITDHGISLDISGKNGFYSGFAYQS